MSSPINKTTLDHLAKLARIELGEHEKEKLLADLQKIVGYFEELNTLDTSGATPMAGGTRAMNVFREDEERTKTNQGKGTSAFPESERGFMKVPGVFEE